MGAPESGGADTAGGDGSCPGPTCLAQAMSSWEMLGSTHVLRGADSHCGVCAKSAV